MLITPRSGFSVLEALIALLLLLLILQAGWAITTGMARGAAALADRSESLAAARATAWIIQEELEGARAGLDVSIPSRDTIALRAFRGTALVCAFVAPSALPVRWSGVRAPDPAKDSALALLGSAARSGEWFAVGLRSRSAAPGACPWRAGGVEERWTVDEPVGAPVVPSQIVLLRVFERGSYHVSDEALRYRIGSGGRQPLTPPALDPVRSGLSASAPGRLVLAVATRGSRGGRNGPAWERVFPLAGVW